MSLFIYLSIYLFKGGSPLVVYVATFVQNKREPTLCTAVDFQSVRMLPRLLYYAKVYVTF